MSLCVPHGGLTSAGLGSLELPPPAGGGTGWEGPGTGADGCQGWLGLLPVAPVSGLPRASRRAPVPFTF